MNNVSLLSCKWQALFKEYIDDRNQYPVVGLHRGLYKVEKMKIVPNYSKCSSKKNEFKTALVTFFKSIAHQCTNIWTTSAASKE